MQQDTYTKRQILYLLNASGDDDVGVEDLIDLTVGIGKLALRHVRIIYLVRSGYSIPQAAAILHVQKPYRFFRSALRSLTSVMNGGKATR